ncbi:MULTISPECIES: nucleoid-associated protein [unclassified Mesorhizobium]|uniref:nucleoid-associated protein n=1 Tax=unclassified Mesorhizobium TaxID=325217 RepID=UPI0015E350A3|nr:MULTISPECIES: nucleoid-associated protein [unclassified Mesorhizobium]MBZ9700968.1 nucleoid-associated protein [Mesorhizobium sp. CO1-1-3]MBZ9946904.1 nucleoid-associated protein [Mesorhizobium sp. BR1-1-11]
MVEQVIQVAVHDLKKDSENFETVSGNAHLKVSKTVERVVGELHAMYASRASKSHGRFAASADNYPAQTYLDEFRKGDFKDFATLTAKLMTTLTVQARRKPGATGGHVLFAHLEKDEQRYLLVAIINDKLGAALTKNFDIASVEHLDLDGFRFAGRINITAWTNSADRYIGFLKGKGNVAEYFKEFLGCDSTVQDLEDTRTLVRVLNGFAEPAKGFVKDKQAFLQKAYDICQRYIRDNEPLDLETFSNELFPDNPKELAKTLGDPDVGLSDGFVPKKRALSPMVKFSAKTRLWSVEFNRQALTDGKIVYNDDKKTLTFTELPAELIERLEHDQE